MTTRQFFGLLTGHNAARCFVKPAVPNIAMRQITVWHVIAMRPSRIVS